MKIKDLQNSILSEGVLLTEQRSYKLWESAGQKLKEAELTVDQIQQLFQQVEQGATGAGGNRTLLGKGKDAASAVNKAWEDLKTKVQNSGPIQAVDQAYDGAVAKIEAGLGGPDNAVNQIIQKYRKFAKEHPIAQGFIYSALIAAAGISGAGLGGAAVLGLLKMADKLLQGEKFSSAAYSGAKTGAMAYAAGQVGQALKGSAPTGPGMDAKFTDVSKTMPDGTVLPNDSVASNVARQMDVINDLGLPKDATYGQVIQAMKQQGYPSDLIDQAIQDAGKHARTAATQAASTIATDTTMAAAKEARNQASQAALKAVQDAVANGHNPNLQGELADIAARAMEQYAQSQGGKLSYQTIEAIANKAALAAASTYLKESQTQHYVNSKTMLESVDRDLTVRMWALNESLGKPRGGVHLTEAGIKDMMGKAANWVATKGKNLTTKVTADKLMQAWKKAGSPTDSDQVAQVLSGAGVGPDIVAGAYKAAGIPAPAAAPADPGLGAMGNVSPGDDAKTGAASDQTTPSGPSTTDATTSATPTTTGTASPAAPAGQAPATSTAAPAGGTPAGTAPATQSAGGPDAFVQNLIASFNALTPAEKAEIQKELQMAMDASENPNVVKATNESRRAKK